MNPFARVALVATSVICVCATAQAADIDVMATQTSLNPVYGLNTLTADTTWTKDNVYIMTDRVYIPNGVTLTIEPGTKIYSTFDDQDTPEDKSDDEVGTLIVARGGMLIADGTASEPIVFDAIQTLEAERGVDHPLDNDSLIGPEPTVGSTGLWGGVVVLGNAYVANTAGDGTNIGNKLIEGFVPTGFVDGDGDGRPDALEYGFDLTTNTHEGGTTFAQDDEDNSGIIRYVSIRHGGYEFGDDNEINGLTMAGVGRGTTIEFVEVVANVDDAFEWFGGTVNTNNLVAAFSGDDSFDVDEGHQGNHQFIFTIQNPNLGDNLGEWDGVGGADTDSTNPSVIPSNPQFFNVTAVGAGAASFTNSNLTKDNGLYIDDHFRGGLYNSVVHDVVNFAVSFSNDGLVGPGEVGFTNNTIGSIGRYDNVDAGTALNNAPTAYDFYVDGFGDPVDGNTVPGVNPMFTEYERTAEGYLLEINPVPATGSPLLNAPLSPVPVGLSAVSYRGAFGTTNWAKGWTYVSEQGYFGATEDPGTGEPPFVDVDNDGISDTLEASPELQALGFTVGADNSALFASLFTETSLQDLSANDIVVQKVGDDVTLLIPVESSTDLVAPFTPEGNATLLLEDVPADKQFYRFRVGPVE